MSADWDDPMIPTPSLEVYQAEMEADDNFFWRISSGHHLNLLEDAEERIRIALQQHPDSKPCPTCGVDNCATRRILTTQHGGE